MKDETPVRRLKFSAERIELLKDMLQRRGVLAQPISIPVHERPFSGGIPLSFTQERLWFLDQLEPGNAVHNMASAFHSTGTVNRAAIASSFHELIRRHEILRTTFRCVDGQPVQYIAQEYSFRLPLIDLSGLSEIERKVIIPQLMSEAARISFNLETGPLLFVYMVCLKEQEALLLVTLHHIIADGWSVNILIRELSLLYAAVLQGTTATLPQLRLQYADYALWQRENARSQSYRDHLDYWKQLLADPPAALKLPTDRHGDLRSNQGAQYRFTLSAQLVQALRFLSQQEGTTLFVTLITAWFTLLYHYTGQQDLVVGTPVAGRLHRELENLIGFFVNIVPLRTSIDGHVHFRDFLRQVRKTVLEALAHQEAPFEHIVAAVSPERDGLHHPLFQILFTFHSFSHPQIELTELTLTNLPTYQGQTQFDLALDLYEEAESIAGIVEYRTAIFKPESIVFLAEHLQNLLASVVANPDQCLKDLPYLREAEQQLLHRWNTTIAPFSHQLCMHQIMSNRAQEAPDVIAIISEEGSLSYGKFEQLSEALGVYLQTLGVGPEVCVGLCLERSLEQMIGMLGILKAGGASVVLDPDFPQERLLAIARDAGIAVIVTRQKYAALFDQLQCTGNIVCLDADRKIIQQHNGERVKATVRSGNLAYVIYTSGSTGMPKGVMVTHYSFVNYIEQIARIFGIQESEHILQFSSLTFDAAIEEIFACFVRRATLVLRTNAMLESVQAFFRFCDEQSIQVIDIPTSYWNFIASELAILGISLPSSLRLVTTGTERALPERLRLWQRYAGNRIQLLNTYGPAEATIGVSACDITHFVEPNAEIPIGKVLPNTQIYILDQHLLQVPIGVFGELYIGGVAPARGYIHRPEFTAERFLPDPFVGTLLADQLSAPSRVRSSPIHRGSVVDRNFKQRLTASEPGARLYRTGDIARYRPDGLLEFLGRVDHQVKLRGFRIELEEIEAVLCSHTSVSSAVVLLSATAHGDKRLVGYVVPLHEQAISQQELQRYLKTKLPEYMIPTVFIFLQAMPITSSGKINRKALPPPESVLPEAPSPGDAPGNPTEEALLSLWKTILDREYAGIHDNFFDLGGHSLLAIQMISRIRQAFQVDLPLRILFEAPTIAGVAAYIEEYGRPEPLSPLQNQTTSTEIYLQHAIQPAPRDRALPLSYAQQRLWIVHQLDPDDISYNIFAAFRIKGRLHISALHSSLTEIMRRHEVLRTTFAMETAFVVQRINPPAPFVLPVIDMSELETAKHEAELMRLAYQEATTPFALSKGPLVRAVLLRLGMDQHALLLTLHHIVIDGWSIELMNRELSLLYTAFIRGEPCHLPKLPIQYADYAVWQRQWVQGRQFEKQMSFWRQQLAGAPGQLPLPTDYPRTNAFDSRGAMYSFFLTPEQTRQLKAFSQQEGVTLFMTILAVWLVHLYQQTRQEDIVVGTSIAGRNHADTENLIGFFVNILPLRTKLTGNPSFRQILQRVKRVALEALENQDVPFDVMVSELHPGRLNNFTPLLQVLLTFYHTQSIELSPATLSVEPIAFEPPTVKYDIVLLIDEQKDVLRIIWNYNVSLFAQATIVLWASQFEKLLKRVVQDPDLALHVLESGLLQDQTKRVDGKQRRTPRRNALRTIKPQSMQIQEEEL